MGSSYIVRPAATPRIPATLGAMLLVFGWLAGCGGDDEATGATSAASTTGPGGPASTGTGAGGTGTGGVGPGGAGAGGHGGTAECALGTSWSLVDDFVFSPGEPSNPEALAAGPGGVLYASGLVKKGMFRALIRKSVDGGATWSIVETAVDPDDPSEYIGGSGLVVDPSGVVYVIGGRSGGAFGARVVSKSADGGATWQNVDSVPFDDGPCNTGAIALDAKGVLHTAGSCDVSGWTVRRSEDAGTTWATVDSFQLAPGHIARSGDVFADVAGRVFVGGAPLDMLDVRHWIVRSPDTGGVWSTADDYQLAAGAHATPGGFGGRTRTFAAGSALPAPSQALDGTHWIVRVAGSDGTSWTTIDDYAASTTSTGEARGVYEDPRGSLLVVGTVADAGVRSAVARRSDDRGATWQTVDTYSYVSGKSTSPVHITSDAAGNVFVLLRGLDATDNAHWLVRKLACGG